jgi:hypothetical protein
MFDVRPVGTVDEEGFTDPVPCKIEALLRSIVRGACEAEFRGTSSRRHSSLG